MQMSIPHQSSPVLLELLHSLIPTHAVLASTHVVIISTVNDVLSVILCIFGTRGILVLPLPTIRGLDVRPAACSTRDVLPIRS